MGEARVGFEGLAERLRHVQPVHTGIYESLLTDQLNQQLERRDDLQAEYGTVDEAEQALTIARPSRADHRACCAWRRHR